MASLAWSKWRRRGFQVLIILMLFFALRAWQQRDMVSGSAPELAGPLLDGQYFSLAAWRGKPALVHFWATWCLVCALEENTIDALASDYQVITIAMQSGDDAEVASYLRENELGFSVLNDPDGIHAENWGVAAVPASFVVDASGRIRFTEVGYTSGIGLRVRLWLATQ